VADIDFGEASDENDADIWYWVVGDDDIGSNLGEHDLPAAGTGEPLYGAFNRDSLEAAELVQGGYDFVTFIHEIGHGLGLSHPHDAGLPGAAPDETNFPGVTEEFDDYGDFDLNQGIWTTMSYNDGWPSQHPSRYQTAAGGHGYQGTPMALDIAAVQAIYGANQTFAAGDSTYAVPTVNAPGTFWSCLWDTGGADTITAAAAAGGCTINLNQAPLTGPDAGGYVSSVAGIFGGFTIANGVTIENAVGGSGDDTLVGNGASNELRGGAGRDAIDGGAGSDLLLVSGGELVAGEVYDGGSEADMLRTDAATLDLTLVTLTSIESITTTRSAGTAFTVGSVADALLVHGASGTGDSLTLAGAVLTDAQRTQIFAQGIEQIVDAAGSYSAADDRNDAPVALDDAATLNEDAAVSGSVLGNDTDVDGPALSVASVDGFAIGAAGTVVNGVYGTLTIRSDGTYAYAADMDAADGLQTGQAATESFSYVASDGSLTDDATLTFSIMGVGEDVLIWSRKSKTSIRDFNPAEDQILLDDTAFRGLGTGTPDGAPFASPKAFAVNTTGLATKKKGAQIIYEKDTGKLWYDADGKQGDADAVNFAVLKNKAPLSISDFELF
jgi:VCBS repeat-containing protein